MLVLNPSTFRGFTVAIATFITSVMFAQTRFKYQGVVRDEGDTIVTNEPVRLRFTLHQDTEDGLPVFIETHDSLSTSSIGLVTVLIGSGDPGFGSLDSIPWSDHTYYLQVEVDVISSGLDFLEMGVSPIVSVPIAEHAKNSGKPWRLNANGIHYAEGNVGIGDTLPEHALDVTGTTGIRGLLDITNTTHTKIRLYSDAFTNDNGIGSYDEDSTRMWYLNTAYRADQNSFALYSDHASSYVWRMTRDGLMELRSPGFSRKVRLFSDGSTDNIISSHDGSNERWSINMLEQANGDRFSIRSEDFGGTVLQLEPDGRTRVRCLEILGGCDINERFNSAETLEPGTVVIADPDRPGQIRMTERPYDHRVVGAISGANGIKPGLTLTQEGTSLDGTHPVALDGRVYVKVAGMVQVGDLLTTSAEPGKAMAAKNRRKAFGAVIGKALESDADGDGLVLMLVQPR